MLIRLLSPLKAHFTCLCNGLEPLEQLKGIELSLTADLQFRTPIFDAGTPIF